MIGVNSFSALAAAGSISAALLAFADGAHSIFQAPPIEGRAHVTSPVFPGEMVTVRWDIIKRSNCPGMTARGWQGENGFALSEPFQPTALPMGSGTYRIPTIIPQTAPAGDLQLTISGYFECQHKRQKFELTPVVMQVGSP